jgi:hypothetical protein
LRSGYHRGGEYRAYPVVDREEWGPVRLESLPRWESRMRRTGWNRAIRPTYHFGHGLISLFGRLQFTGLEMTLHSRSTFRSFPSPSPRRGWQGSEHCPRSFGRRIAPSPVRVGTPGITGFVGRDLLSTLLDRPWRRINPPSGRTPANWTAYGLFLVQCYSDPES